MRFKDGENVVTTIYYHNETGKRQTRDIVLFFGTYNRETGDFKYEHFRFLGRDDPFEMNKDKSHTTRYWYIPIGVTGTYDIMLALGQYNSDTNEFKINENEICIKEDYIEIYD